jgi:hypothetical protein
LFSNYQFLIVKKKNKKYYILIWNSQLQVKIEWVSNNFMLLIHWRNILRIRYTKLLCVVLSYILITAALFLHSKLRRFFFLASTHGKVAKALANKFSMVNYQTLLLLVSVNFVNYECGDSFPLMKQFKGYFVCVLMLNCFRRMNWGF